MLEHSYEQDETTQLRQQHQALLDLEQDEWSKNLVSVLLSYGASETKRLFMVLNDYFLSSKHRLQIVYLLSEFLLRKYDNSTTLIAISVTNLIMLLPRMCTSLPPYLPQLFYIFARALCWDQLRDLRQKQGITKDEESNSNSTSATRKAADGWDCAENKFDIPEEFDEETFRSRTIAQVSRHMLHPSLVTMDTESELTDRSRWMKMEPPDVIAQIMSLDLTNAASRVAFSTGKDQKREQQEDLLDESVWAHTENVSEDDQQYTHPQEEKQSPHDEPPTATVQNILDMHQALRSGTEVLIGDDVWVYPITLTVSAATAEELRANHGNTSETSLASSNISPETRLLIAALKREVLLLRNELNFELFVKQQHLQHMGRLHREHMVDSSVEAERQRTYNATRMLRAQLKQATTALNKLKTESARTKQKHVNWENEQSEKLRGYREARKKWQADMEEARQKLQEYEKAAEAQNAELLEAQKRVFELESELKTHEPLLEKAEENEHRVMQLTKQMLLWQEDTAQLEEQKEYIKGLLSQWRSMEELVESLQSENQKLSARQR
ncbi:hypothetical protein K492DRAFT_124197 [Lichtheimia hyalospora FSU 10163]|nr:hypothetical protein K492DRAFT_124197 [Lichtheimia hyalospora FSU 10163]